MSNELYTTSTTGRTNLYSVVLNKAGQIYDTVSEAFEDGDSTSWTNYDITMVESDASGIYRADFPTAVTTRGLYSYEVRIRIGASPAVADPIFAIGEVDWDGSAIVTTGGDYVITLAEYKAFDSSITDTSLDTYIEAYIPKVHSIICKYLNTDLISASRTEIYNGNGADYVRVKTTPVTAVSSIIFDVNENITTTVAGTNFVYQSRTGLIKFKGSSINQREFSEGFQNISVTYTGGYTVVPDGIKLAACLMVQRVLAETDPLALVDEKSVGDVKIKFGVGYIDINSPTFHKAKEMLDEWKQTRYI